MVTLRPFTGLVPTEDVRARTVGGARRSAARLARRSTHPRHVAWLEGTLDTDPADVEDWIADGSLTVDDRPRLRLVEQTMLDGHCVLGVVGLVELHDLVPHEGTDEGAVRRRIERDRRQQVDSRPLLAVLPADPPGTPRLTATIREREPELHVEDADGVVHRTWVLTDDEAAAITAALAPYPCLLADGHHRVAAAAALGRRAVPAMVAFASSAPLLDDVWRLAAVPRDAQEAAAAWVAGLADAPGDDPDVVTVRHRDVVRHVRPSSAELPVEATMRLARQVPHVARVTSTADTTAMAIAIRDGAVVVGSRAPTVTEVLAAVASGRALPPKSTAFRPKPRVGLVLHRVPASPGDASRASQQEATP